MLSASTFTEDFDGVVAPALPAGWTTSNSGAGGANWTTSVAAFDTAPNSAFVPDNDDVGDNRLTSPSISVAGVGAQLTFRHSFDFENDVSDFDGGVLEIAIGAGAFTDIIAAGGSFVTGGYTGTIDNGFENPLANRSAWTNNSGGFITTTVNLPASALGQNVQLRWREGTDNSIADTGWFVDSVSVSGVVIGGVVNVDANCDPAAGNQADDGNSDTFRVVENGANTEVFVNGNLAIRTPTAGITVINVDGSGDDDTLIIDNAGGLVDQSFVYDGMGGANDMQILGNPGVPILQEVYRVGLTPDTGNWLLDPDGSTGEAGGGPATGDELTVFFQNLSPVDSTTPATDFDVILTAGLDNVTVDNGAAVSGFQTTRISAATIETVQFARKQTVELHGLDGGDLFSFNNPNPAFGLQTLRAFGHASAGVAGSVDPTDDGANESYRLVQTGGGVTWAASGQDGSDLFDTTFGGLLLDGLFGTLTFDAGESAADEDVMILSDQDSLQGPDQVTLTATSVTGAAPGSFTYSGLERLFLETTSGNDTINVLSTPAGLVAFLTGDGGSDTITIGNQTPDFGTVFDGSLDNILGEVVVASEYLDIATGTDTLNVDDSGTASLAGAASITSTAGDAVSFGPFLAPITGTVDTELVNFAPARIRYFHNDLFGGQSRLENLNVIASTGQDTINVNHTTATGQTTVNAFQGNDFNTVAINGDGLSADNTFSGDTGADRFILNVANDLGAASFVPLTGLSVIGDAPQSQSAARDVLHIRDTSNAARGLIIAHANPSILIVATGFAIAFSAQTMETVVYDGNAGGTADNDSVFFSGSPAVAEQITVAPLSASSALVFVGGDPWDGPQEGSFFDQYPGVAGGSSYTDLFLDGLNPAIGLGVSGGPGNNNRLYVYGRSELPLTDPATTIDPYDGAVPGGGVGVIVPGFGIGNAFDNILVSDTRVRFLDDFFFFNDVLIPIDIDTSTFVQTNPLDDGLVVNAGFEQGTRPNGIADDITVTPSARFGIQINGGDPVPTAQPDGCDQGPGDRLNAFFPGEINIWSDLATPPNVTIAGSGLFGVGFSSIEQFLATPGDSSRTVNVIGDNNTVGAAFDQDDVYQVEGRDTDSTVDAFHPQPEFNPDPDGDNEFCLIINGSAPIHFRNVAYLNLFGEEAERTAGDPLGLPPSWPDTSPQDSGDDTLIITPYADNTPQNWAIDVRFDGGNPASSDEIIYNGVNGVIDAVTVATSGPQSGSIVVPGVVTIDYQDTEDLIINANNGTLGDLDSLTVRGLNVADSLTVDLREAGDDANPVAVIAGIIDIENFTNLNHVRFELEGGNDLASVTPDVDGAGVNRSQVGVTVVGGTPSSGFPGDRLQVNGVGGTVSFTPGSESDQGAFIVDPDGAGATPPAAAISFDEIESATVTDQSISAIVTGTPGDDDITIIATGPNAFNLSINGAPPIRYSSVGQLAVNSLGGDDVISVSGIANWGVNLTVDGGHPTASDTLIVNNVVGIADALVVEPTAQGAGSVRNFTGLFPPVVYAGIEHIRLVGQLGENDVFGVGGTAGNDVFNYTPSATPDTGTVHGTMAGSTFTLGDIVFAGMQPSSVVRFNVFLTAGGNDQFIFNGLADNDTIAAVSPGTIDSVEVRQTLAGQLHSLVNVGNITRLDLLGRDGDDTFNVQSDLVSNGNVSVFVSGGDPSASDVLNYTGTGGLVTTDLQVRTLTETGFGPVAFAGIEHVNIAVAGGALTVDGTALDDVITYTPTLAQAGRFTLEGLNTVFAFSAVAGQFTINGQGTIADEVIVVGTNNHDVMTIDQGGRTVTLEIVVGIVWKPVTLGTTVEIVTAKSLLGNDTFLVIPAAGVGGGLFNLLVNVDGGLPGASDALVVAGPNGAQLPANQFVVVNRGRDANTGVVRVFQDTAGAGNEPTQFPDITYTDVEVVSPNVATRLVGGQAVPNLLILGPDNFEPNEFVSTPAFLGTAGVINQAHLALFPNSVEHRFVPADLDVFRVVAQQTGTLDFQVYFTQVPEFLPGSGNVQINVLDEQGNVINNFGVNDFTANDERRRIPVVAGETYYLQVFGANNLTVNGYDLTIVNTPAPVPYALEISDFTAARFGGVLNGAQENPPVATAAVGSVELILNQVTNTFSIDVFVTGIELPAPGGLPDLSASHIHLGAIGVNGPVILNLGTANWFADGNGIRLRRTGLSFTGPDAAANLAALLAGNTYVNVHTNVNPTGEVRGQLNFLGIIENSDSGRSQLDNYTCDNTPTIFIRVDDEILLSDLPGGSAGQRPPDGQVIPIPHVELTAFDVSAPGFRVAVFDETNTHAPILLGYAQPLGGQTGVYIFTVPAAASLPDGSHFITAKVEMVDPSFDTDQDFGAVSFPMEIVVDTVPPPVFFGSPAIATDGLDPSSDSGVIGYADTFIDRITNDTTPSFFGTAEANAIVRLYVDRNGDGVVDAGDVFIGETVAVPLDGTNQFPGGQWNLTSVVDFNNPNFFLFDGTRRILATAEDLAGKVSDPVSLLIFIDTQGPQVTSVFITDFPAYDIFDPKPLIAGPTPLVNRLTVTLRDLPPRDTLNFPLYRALVVGVATQPGHYELRGDQNGVIPIQSVTVVFGPDVDGQPATASIILRFFSPLPDDRFTLTLKDDLTDPANNHLDGENNAIQPLETPLFPSGDRQPGNDFVARFTVDTRPEIAAFSTESTYIDINGNFVWDPEGQDNDYTNRDLVFNLAGFGPDEQWTSDFVFAGNFSQVGGGGGGGGGFGAADGFDKLASYGFVDGVWRFLIDLDSDGVADLRIVQPPLAGASIDALPVAGDFDGNALNGDEIALFDGVSWILDTNHDYVVDMVIVSQLRGYPIVGDFDGDGDDDLATWAEDQFRFDLDSNGTLDRTINFGFPGVNDRPVAHDMDQDGIDDVGVWVTGRTGQLPRNSGEWYFLISGDFNPNDGVNDRVQNTVVTLDHEFSPIPLGRDVFAQFGDQFAIPLVGNFDPPIGPPSVQNALDTIGLYNPATGTVYANDANEGGMAANTFNYGPAGSNWVIITGDWNADGVASVGLYDPATGVFHLRNENSSGVAQANFQFGPGGQGWQPIVGDWDADGDETVGLYNPATGTFYLRNDLSPGFAHVTFAYGPGNQGWLPTVGDWDNDGDDSVGLFSPGTGTWYLRNVNSTGFADSTFAYGPAGSNWLPIVGDWNQDGTDTIGLYNPTDSVFHQRNTNSTGVADNTFMYGPAGAGWRPIVGDWDGTGGALQRLAGAAVHGSTAPVLTDSQLAGIVHESIDRWAALGLSDEQVAVLRSAEFRVVDFQENYLGIAFGGQILIDQDAAGLGWFVDSTPESDEEFQSGAPAGDAVDYLMAQEGVDLLTVVSHELGHLLGLGSQISPAGSDDLMELTLAAGVRRNPTPDLLDRIFKEDDFGL
jgi:hypothetical protein